VTGQRDGILTGQRAEATRGPGLDPLALASALVLEDGRTWGEACADWQRIDADAVLDRSPGAPRRHYLLRGRGMSKTTDVAALVLVLLLTEAPPRSRSHVYAVDAEQARIFVDTLAGLVSRTPGLGGALEISPRSVSVRSSGPAWWSRRATVPRPMAPGHG